MPKEYATELFVLLLTGRSVLRLNYPFYEYSQPQIRKYQKVNQMILDIIATILKSVRKMGVIKRKSWKTMRTINFPCTAT